MLNEKKRLKTCGILFIIHFTLMVANYCFGYGGRLWVFAIGHMVMLVSDLLLGGYCLFFRKKKAILICGLAGLILNEITNYILPIIVDGIHGYIIYLLVNIACFTIMIVAVLKKGKAIFYCSSALLGIYILCGMISYVLDLIAYVRIMVELIRLAALSGEGIGYIVCGSLFGAGELTLWGHNGSVFIVAAIGILGYAQVSKLPFAVEKSLIKLKKQYDSGRMTQEDYETQKRELLDL